MCLSGLTNSGASFFTFPTSFSAGQNSMRSDGNGAHNQVILCAMLNGVWAKKTFPKPGVACSSHAGDANYAWGALARAASSMDSQRVR